MTNLEGKEKAHTELTDYVRYGLFSVKSHKLIVYVLQDIEDREKYLREPLLEMGRYPRSGFLCIDSFCMKEDRFRKLQH